MATNEVQIQSIQKHYSHTQLSPMAQVLSLIPLPAQAQVQAQANTVNVTFVADNLALWQTLLKVIWFTPTSNITPVPHTHIFIQPHHSYVFNTFLAWLNNTQYASHKFYTLPKDAQIPGD
jgi:hypothetical protein